MFVAQPVSAGARCSSPLCPNASLLTPGQLRHFPWLYSCLESVNPPIPGHVSFPAS